jgi:hypothetical protein
MFKWPRSRTMKHSARLGREKSQARGINRKQHASLFLGKRGGSSLRTPTNQVRSFTECRAGPGGRPQFGLKAIFGFTTWTAAIAGLAVSRFGGWTMFAVGLSLTLLNCSGRLAGCQRPPGQTRCFQAAWLLLMVSLFLPAMKGCNNTSIRGWEAATTCFEIVLDPPPEISRQSSGYAVYCLCAAANLLLALSPLFLWRLRRGKGAWYGLLLVVTVPAMWCMGNSNGLLIGYYLWCAGGLAVMCAFRMRWAMLPLMGATPLLVWFAHQGGA